MNVYCLQFDSEWNEKERNFESVSSMLNEHSIEERSLIVLPEMFATGFSLNPGLTTFNEPGKTEIFLSKLALERKSWVIGGMCQPSNVKDMAYNTAVTFNPLGEKISLYKKIHLIPVLNETKYHLPGKSIESITIDAFQVTPAIWYDLRFPELFRLGVKAGATLFVVLGCWPKSRIEHWVTLLKARAIENQAYLVGVNRIGKDKEMEYGGKSMIICPKGEILAGDNEDHGVIEAAINQTYVRKWRNAVPADMELSNGAN